MALSRFYYNKAVEAVNNRYEERKKFFEDSLTCIHCSEPKQENSYTCKSHAKKKIPWNLNISFISLRNEIIKSDKELLETPHAWHIEVPYDVRQLVVNDVITAYKSAITNKLRGNIQHFRLGFKRYDKFNGMFHTTKSALKIDNQTASVFVRRLKSDKFLKMSKRSTKKLPKSNEAQSKIIMKNGECYLILSVKSEKVAIPDNRNFAISLDPGVRTFQSGYDLSGLVMEFGREDIAKLKNLHIRIDKLSSIKTRILSKSRSNIAKKIQKLHLKIKNTVHNMHLQIASFLSRNYQNVLLPRFNTSQMLSSNTLPSSVKRMMGCLSFYKFSEALKYSCAKYKCNLFRVDEHYTSKLCGNCGVLNDPKTSKVYRCKCGTVLDRDFNAARNILLQYLCL
jgi:putative transposase